MGDTTELLPITFAYFKVFLGFVLAAYLTGLGFALAQKHGDDSAGDAKPKRELRHSSQSALLWLAAAVVAVWAATTGLELIAGDDEQVDPAQNMPK